MNPLIVTVNFGYCGLFSVVAVIVQSNNPLLSSGHLSNPHLWVHPTDSDANLRRTAKPLHPFLLTTDMSGLRVNAPPKKG